jgi:hypothetical protein
MKLIRGWMIWSGLNCVASLVSAWGTPRAGIETMKKSAKALPLCFAVGVVGLCLATANATTVIPPTFEEMTDRAELIFVCKVVSSRAEWRTVGTNRVLSTRCWKFFSVPGDGGSAGRGGSLIAWCEAVKCL